MDQITPALSLQNKEMQFWGHYCYDGTKNTVRLYHDVENAFQVSLFL